MCGCGKIAHEATLSSGDGMEVILHRFLGVLNGIEPQIAQRMQEEISSRFGGRYCSDRHCALMAEMIRGYLSGERSPGCSLGLSLI